ncbi:MAG: TrmH family RNA methyltransferase [Desulfuromonadales bacterium]|nr:TrmH family RNA methyltransferase [Desulfuromonadales bacterium]
MRRGYKQIVTAYQKERNRNLLAQPGPHGCVVVLDTLKPGYNVAKIFRSAEAFGLHAVHLINIGPFDPAPAKGSFRKVPARFHETFSDCYADLTAQGYVFFLLDAKARESMINIALPRKTAFVFGHEEFGFGFDAADYPAVRAVSIPQFGNVESLNVSVAASVAMYEYVRQWASSP